MLEALLLSFVLCRVATAFAVEAPSPPTYGVRMERVWIPMKDGVRLAATLYMPEGAKPGEKFPAVLDYLPYRKDDSTAAGDYPRERLFCSKRLCGSARRYPGIRRQRGRPTDREYSQREQI